MSELVITGDNFEQEVIGSDKPVVLDFWATWCGPCRMFAPVLDAFAQKHPEIKVGKINVDDEEELAASHSVMSIPTVVVYKNGEIVSQTSGVQSIAALEAMVKYFRRSADRQRALRKRGALFAVFE